MRLLKIYIQIKFENVRCCYAYHFKVEKDFLIRVLLWSNAIKKNFVFLASRFWLFCKYISQFQYDFLSPKHYCFYSFYVLSRAVLFWLTNYTFQEKFRWFFKDSDEHNFTDFFISKDHLYIRITLVHTHVRPLNFKPNKNSSNLTQQQNCNYTLRY